MNILGALLREKMVEAVSDKFICIVDESKLSKGTYNLYLL